MSGHFLRFDGERLGLTPDSDVSEVYERLREVGVGFHMRVHTDCIIIMFDNKDYYFKDRLFGRCDFKSAPPPEYPICGE